MTLSFKYNVDGIRTQKTVNGTATNYFLNGNKILAQKTGSTAGSCTTICTTCRETLSRCATLPRNRSWRSTAMMLGENYSQKKTSAQAPSPTRTPSAIVGITTIPKPECIILTRDIMTRRRGDLSMWMRYLRRTAFLQETICLHIAEITRLFMRITWDIMSAAIVVNIRLPATDIPVQCIPRGKRS